jgi:hypothetical protein
LPSLTPRAVGQARARTRRRAQPQSSRHQTRRLTLASRTTTCEEGGTTTPTSLSNCALRSSARTVFLGEGEGLAPCTARVPRRRPQPVRLRPPRQRARSRCGQDMFRRAGQRAFQFSRSISIDLRVQNSHRPTARTRLPLETLRPNMAPMAPDARHQRRGITSLLSSQWSERDVDTPPQQRYSMTRSRKEWVAETLETPLWAVSLEGKRIRPQPGSAQRLAPQQQRRGPTPHSPGTQDGTGGAEEWVAEQWPPQSASPPRTPLEGQQGRAEGEPSLHHADQVTRAVERASGRKEGAVQRQNLEPATWPPPLPAGPASSDVAQQWRYTIGAVRHSPRGGMVSAGTRGLRGPKAAGTVKIETLLNGAKSSVPHDLHTRDVLTPRGRLPDSTPAAEARVVADLAAVESTSVTLGQSGQSARWVYAEPQQSLYSTWSSLPAPEHSLEETWANDPNAAKPPPERSNTRRRTIKGSPRGRQVHILCVAHL